jgi:Lrp/AsnC family transcriptional regulator for asnA, asnC and gidA
VTNTVELDEKDEEIIRQFQRDGRLSNRAVGEIVGLSEGAVRKRLKRLSEAGAVSYGVVVDIQATEMGVSGYLAVEVTAAALQSVSEYISNLETCSLCVITTGEANIRAYIYGKDLRSLSRSTATIAGLGGVIRVQFREAVYFTQHRYELIMMPDEHHGSAWSL